MKLFLYKRFIILWFFSSVFLIPRISYADNPGIWGCFETVYPNVAASTKGPCNLTSSKGNIEVYGNNTLNINAGGTVNGTLRGRHEGFAFNPGAWNGDVIVNINTDYSANTKFGTSSDKIDHFNITGNNHLTLKEESYTTNVNVDNTAKITTEGNGVIHGTITGKGTVSVNNDYNVSDAYFGKSTDDRLGRLEVGSKGNLTINNGYYIDKAKNDGTLNLNNDGYISTLDNNELLNLKQGITLTGNLNNLTDDSVANFEDNSKLNGNIVNDNGNTNFNKNITVNGNITVSSGNVNMKHNFKNQDNKTITVNGDGHVWVYNPGGTTGSYKLTNGGTINIDSKDAMISGEINNDKTINLASGTINGNDANNSNTGTNHSGRVDNSPNGVMNINNGIMEEAIASMKGIVASMEGTITGGTVNIMGNYFSSDSISRGGYDNGYTFFGEAGKAIKNLNVYTGQRLVIKNDAYVDDIKLKNNASFSDDDMNRFETRNNDVLANNSVKVTGNITTEKNLIDYLLFDSDTTTMAGSIGTTGNRVRQITVGENGNNDKDAIFSSENGDINIFSKRIILNTGSLFSQNSDVSLSTTGDNDVNIYGTIYANSQNSGELYFGANKTTIIGSIGGQIIREDQNDECIKDSGGACMTMVVDYMKLERGKQLEFYNNGESTYMSAHLNDMDFTDTKLNENSYFKVNAKADTTYMVSGYINYDYGTRDKTKGNFGIVISQKKNAKNADTTGLHTNVSQAEAFVGLIGREEDKNGKVQEVYVNDNSLYFSTMTREAFNLMVAAGGSVKLDGITDLSEIDSEVLYDSIFSRVKIEEKGGEFYLAAKDSMVIDKYATVNKAGNEAAYNIEDWTFAFIDSDQAHLMRNLQQIDDEKEFYRALNEAAPDISNVLFKSSYISMLSSYNNVQKRLDKIRMLSLNVKNYFETSSAIIRDKKLYNYYDEFYTKNYKDNNVWGETFAGYLTVKDNSYIYGYDAIYFGGTVGYDRRVNKYFTVGSSITASQANTENNADEGSVDKTKVTSLNGNLYTMLAGKTFFFSNYIGITGNKYDQERNMKFLDLERTALADFYGLSYSAGASLGFNLIQEFDSEEQFIIRKINTKYRAYDRDLHISNVVITPSISIFATHFTVEKYKETNTGSIGLEVENKPITSLEAEAKLTFVRNKSIRNNFIMQNMISGFISYNFLETQTKVKARYLGDARWFEAEGWKPKPTTFGGSVGLYFMKADNYQFGVDYNFSSSSEMMSHLLKFNFMYLF